MPVDAGAYYVMDRGYVDSARLYAMHQAGAFFVTRAKAGMDARRVHSDLLDRSTGRALRQSVTSVGRHRPQALQMAAQNGEECDGGRIERPARVGHGHDLAPQSRGDEAMHLHFLAF